MYKQSLKFPKYLVLIAVLLAATNAMAGLQLVVDFEGLSGNPDGQACNGVLGGTLDTQSEATGNSSLRNQDGSNTMSVIGHSSGTSNARAIGLGGMDNPIDEGETGIGFFRFRLDAGNIRPHMGLVTDNDGNPVNATNTQNPETVPAGFRLIASGAGMDLLTLDGATILKAGLSSAQWYNCWIVADNAVDTFDLYLSEAEGPAGEATRPTPEDLIASNLPFSVPTTEPLNGMIFANPTGTGQASRICVDEIWWDGDQGLSAPTTARAPYPMTEGTDIPLDAVLRWIPGQYARTHDLYFGTSFDEIASANRGNDNGVLLAQDLDVNSFDAEGLINVAQTYYWRVDEVNGTPDKTIITGPVWSFESEPLSYPIENVTATASSQMGESGPEQTVNGSGLQDNVHGTAPATMWLSQPDHAPVWIQFDFDRTYKLDKMLVWNYNGLIEPTVGFGLRTVIIETSQDGDTWVPLGDNDGQYILNQAAGQSNSGATSQISLNGTIAQSVRITVVDGWGVFFKQYGLSEVRFMSIPAQAREPRPANEQLVDVRNPLLTWRKGRGSVAHNVLIDTDLDAVLNGTAKVITVNDNEVDSTALDLNFGATYYWLVNEVNSGGEVMTGDLWQFSVKDSFLIEDFESYTNESPTRPFQTWIDGYGFTQPEPGNPGNGTGSAVGHDIWAFGSPYTQIMERANVFAGAQALPMYYDNSGDNGKAKYSEIERTFDIAQDWEQGGVDHLIIHAYGAPPRFVETEESILLSGAGTDIWNTADQFRFAWKKLTGDGTIIARVDSLLNTNAWAKAGVMIRETLDPGSTNAGMYYAQENGVRFQARLLVDTAAQSQTAALIPADQTGQRAPVWVKVERKGSDFTTYYSQDGVTWTLSSWGTQTINMASTVYIGLAVTSHNPAMTTAAEFSNVQTLGNVTGAWQIEDVGVSQPSNTVAPLYIALQDSSQHTAVVIHENPNAVTSGQWLTWAIPLDQFTGVNTHAIRKIMIGVGDRKAPQTGGQGILLIDEITVGKSPE